MPSFQRRSFTVGPEQYDDIMFTVDSQHNPDHEGSAGYGWEIEVPAVLRMFDAVVRGDATAVEARKALVEAVTFESGCCWYCDSAGPFYDEALLYYRRRKEVWDREHAAETPESHPYLVGTSEKIHSLQCAHASGDQAQPVHPGRTLHEFAIKFEHLGGLYFGMEHFDHALDAMAMRSPTRMTSQQVAERLARAMKDPRCKICQPPLPGAWTSESSGHPGDEASS